MRSCWEVDYCPGTGGVEDFCVEWGFIMMTGRFKDTGEEGSLCDRICFVAGCEAVDSLERETGGGVPGTQTFSSPFFSLMMMRKG